MTVGDGPPANFGVTADFASDHAVLSITGEVVGPAAWRLGAFFDALVLTGHASVMLDLAGVQAIDAAGLSLIAGAGQRLAELGGGLTIRSPSIDVGGAGPADANGPAEMNGLAEMRGSTDATRSMAAPVAEPPLAESGTSITEESHGLARDLRKMAATPLHEDVVDGFLRLLVSLAGVTVGAADGASVTLRRRGRLSTVAASDRTILAMDSGQYATGEGPCVDAVVKGRWFHVQSLETETRWPAFTPRARALGINAILSSPLLVRGDPVGALNIYSNAAGAFAPKDQKLASVFASEASIILADAGVDVTDDVLAARIGEALRTRRLIAQAEGVLMQREGISGDAAYSVLRSASVGTGTSLSARAAQVVESARPQGSHAGPGR